MKLDWRREWAQWALITGMFVLAAMMWNRSLNQIPIHWNAAGDVDDYGGKFEGLLLQPIMAAGLYVLMIALPRIDPGRANYANFSTAYDTIRVSVIALQAAVYVLIVRAIQGSNVNIGVIVPLAVGVMMIAVGNVLPKLRPNWFVGIRTPWTLSSKTSWDRTHRFGGRLFVAMGLVCMLGVLLPPELRVALWIATIIGLVSGLYVFSYVAWRGASDKVPPSGTTAA
jgi:uncharacterized membrane protein